MCSRPPRGSPSCGGLCHVRRSGDSDPCGTILAHVASEMERLRGERPRPSGSEGYGRFADRDGPARARTALAHGEPAVRLPHARTVELRGHIIDSHILSQVMDLVMDHNAEFYIEQFEVGKHKFDPSYCRIALHAATTEALDDLLETVNKLGAQGLEADEIDARGAPAPADGVLPDGFHCTTNMPTEVRAGGVWLPVEGTEMDVAIALRLGPDLAPTGAYTVPMADVRAGTPVVIGHEGMQGAADRAPAQPGAARVARALDARARLQLHVQRGQHRAAEGGGNRRVGRADAPHPRPGEAGRWWSVARRLSTPARASTWRR